MNQAHPTSMASETLYMAGPSLAIIWLSSMKMKWLVLSSSKQSSPPRSDGVILRSFESSGETQFEALILDLLHERAVRLNSLRPIFKDFPNQALL